MHLKVSSTYSVNSVSEEVWIIFFDMIFFSLVNLEVIITKVKLKLLFWLEQAKT